MANKDREAVNSGLNDLLGNVIRTDRERAGRGKPEVSVPAPAAPAPAPILMETPVVQVTPTISEESDTKTVTHYDTMTEG